MSEKKDERDATVRRELRRCLEQYNEIARDPAWEPVLERLAFRRVRHRELQRAVRRAEGASQATLELTEAARRAADSIERVEGMLRRRTRWSSEPGQATDDPMLGAAATRRALLAKGRPPPEDDDAPFDESADE